jgi:hypothetical protein
VSDAGLRQLTQGNPGLRGLSLGTTRITAAGLAHLQEIRTLAEIHLRRTGVTAAGIQKLKKALPKCKVNP